VKLGPVEMPARYAPWVALGCAVIAVLVFAIPSSRGFALQLISAYVDAHAPRTGVTKLEVLPLPPLVPAPDPRGSATASAVTTDGASGHRPPPPPPRLSCTHEHAASENADGVEVRDRACLLEFKKHPGKSVFIASAPGTRGVKCQCHG
jgi:hypothetical protein